MLSKFSNLRLGSLTKRYLNIENRMEIFDHTFSKLGNLVMNSRLILELSEKFEFLELTFELSRIAGCLWAVSLKSGRAERNEMLLMHYFWQDGYIGNYYIKIMTY